jgi:hypothetical protein
MCIRVHCLTDEACFHHKFHPEMKRVYCHSVNITADSSTLTSADKTSSEMGHKSAKLPIVPSLQSPNEAPRKRFDSPYAAGTSPALLLDGNGDANKHQVQPQASTMQRDTGTVIRIQDHDLATEHHMLRDLFSP